MLTFAFAQAAIGHLNVVTGFLVAILIGLGIEYGVHLAMRYWEERRSTRAREALPSAVRGTFSGRAHVGLHQRGGLLRAACWRSSTPSSSSACSRAWA